VGRPCSSTVGGEVLRGSSVSEGGDAPITERVAEGGMWVGTSGTKRCWVCKGNSVAGLLTLGGVLGAGGSTAAGKHEEAD
jgi:hypothetical protein